MTPDLIPFFGCTQPTLGSNAKLGYSVMATGRAKRPKYAAVRTRRVVAENVLLRMNQRYTSNTDKYKALAEDAGTSLSTIQRVTQPDVYGVGITVDVLTQVAMALRCEPHELLIPPEQAD